MSRLTLELRPPDGHEINVDALGMMLTMQLPYVVIVNNTRLAISGEFEKAEIKETIQQLLKVSGISIEEIEDDE